MVAQKYGFQTRAAFSDLEKRCRRIAAASAASKLPAPFFRGAVLPPFLSMRDAPQAVFVVNEEADNSSANCQKDF